MFDRVFSVTPRGVRVLFSAQRWTDLATAPVVFILPAVAWLTYCSTRRDKLGDRRRRQLDDLMCLTQNST